MTIQKRLATSNYENTEERFGFIVMLDALGVSSFNHEQQRQWLYNRDLMLKHLAEQQVWYLNDLENERKKASERIAQLNLPLDAFHDLDAMISLYKEFQEHSDFSTFSDTVVFNSWGSEKYESPEYSVPLIAAIALSLHEIMKTNIMFNLRLRGAVSLGKYSVSRDTR